MTDVVYILGAGASADALPPVKDFAASIQRQHDWLRASFPLTPADVFMHNGRPVPFTEALEDYVKASALLMQKCGSEKTFDEHALRQWVGHYNLNDATYRQLKAELSTYFAIEQARNMKARKKYEYFLAHLLAKCNGKCIHPSVKILTWNYDQLLLLTLAEMAGWDDMHHVMDQFKVTTLTDGKIRGFSVMHLNGIIGVALGTRTAPLMHGKDPNMRTVILKALELHYVARKLSNSARNAPTFTIGFGWENMKTRTAHLDEIRAEIKDAKALVVIGYSFPAANEEVDKALLKDLDQLEKVYIQMRTHSADIWTKLKLINPRLKDDMLEVKDAKVEPHDRRFYYASNHYR